jgi:hypothetical protein
MGEQQDTENTVQEKTQGEFTITIEPPDSYVFSNVASIAVSPWDIRVNFVDVVPRPDSKDGRFKASVGITMPPECAAGLALLLIEQVRSFEDQFGAIRNPKWIAKKEAAAKSELKAQGSTETGGNSDEG